MTVTVAEKSSGQWLRDSLAVITGPIKAVVRRDDVQEPEPDAPSRPLRVVVIDDEDDLRTLIHALLRPLDGWDVVGDANDAPSGLHVVEEEQPDIILLDLMLPGDSGVAVAPKLFRTAPRAMIVALSALPPSEAASEALGAGAYAYVEKTQLGPDFGPGLRQLYRRFLPALEGIEVWAPGRTWRPAQS